MRVLAWLALAASPWAGSAEERIADIRQGTNLSVAVMPGGDTLIVDLLGQLWSLPVSGGGAVPLTPSGERARNPRLSPDGGRVVYQRLVDGQWDVWLLELATNAARPLTTSPFNEREPDFAPDGASVVFAADRTGHYCLWSVTLAGGVETQLTEEPGDASYPTMSSQGSIAYAHENAGTWSIRVLAPNGASSTLHTSSHPLAAPSWRPGDGVLVFAEHDALLSGRLLMLILGEPRVLKLTSGREDIFTSRPAWASGADFIYAADGQLWRRGIAAPARSPIHLFAASAVPVASTPSDLPWPDTGTPRVAAGLNGLVQAPGDRRATFTALGDLWLVERDTAERLTDDPFVERDPAFFPDGAAIVFSSDRTGQFELWRLALGDRSTSQVTFGAIEPREPAVRPDGRQIAYLEAESYEPWATTRLKVRDWPSGSEITVATRLEQASSPTWSSDGRSLSVRAQGGAATTAATGSLRVTLVRALTDAAHNDSAAGSLEPPALRWAPPPPPPDYVVEVGRLFDGVSATYRRHVDMHVRGGRIAAIVARGMLPPTGPVIDARDRTVVPGFVDVHAHQPAMAGERLGRAWLAHGVTTVRELAPRPREALERAEAWASGRSLGPRLFLSALPDDGTHEDDPAVPVRRFAGIVPGFAHTLPAQAASREWPRGLSPAPPRAWQGLALGGLDDIGLEVSPGLVTYQDGVSRLVASGATLAPGLAVLRGMSAAPTATAAERRRRAAYRGLFNLAEQGVWERSNGLANAVPTLGQTIARFVRAGGRIAVGSEAPALPYGLGFHLELAALAGAGLGNDQVLRMATMGGALALGLEQQIGSLEAGKLADFVILEGDPLSDIGATLDIVAVARGGVWHDRAALIAAP